MKQKDIIYYLQRSSLIDDMSKFRSKEKYVRITCPFAEWKHKNKRDQHQACGIKVDEDNTSFFHCFSCKTHGEFWKMFEMLSMHRREDKDKLLELSDEIHSEDVMKLASGRLARAVNKYEQDIDDFVAEEETPVSLDAMKFQFNTFDPNHEYISHYFKDRGLNPELRKEFDVRYDDIRERITIPVYSPLNDFVGMIGRSIDPDEKIQKVYNYPGTRTDFGFGRLTEQELEDYRRIIVVEGMFDLMKTYQNLVELSLQKEYAVVCVFKSVLSEFQASWLEDTFKPVIIFFDNDEAGKDGWIKAKRLLSGRVPRLSRVITESPENDAGDINSDELYRILKGKKNE